jgi:branched-chain amino acid transport system substrate-binding protein
MAEEEMLMKRILGLAFAAAAFVALSFGAAQAAPSCGLASGKPASGQPIAIGADVTASGGADMSSAPKGAKAYFDCVNANGGINGRPIAYTWLDDQTRPDKAAENAKKLVEDNKAAALVGGASIVDCIATAQYYKDQNIISLMGGGDSQRWPALQSGRGR